MVRPRASGLAGGGPGDRAVRRASRALAHRRDGRRAPRRGPVPGGGGDVEGDVIRGRYLEDFRGALAASFRQLAPRERALLRLHFVNGLNIEAIGTAYGVHRATVARWLVAIRRDLLDQTRELLTMT